MAWGCALTLHAVFAFVLLGTLAGRSIQGVDDPFGEGEAIQVSLSGREGATSTAASTAAADAPEASSLEALADRLQRVESDLFAEEQKPAPSSSSLADLFGSTGATSGKGRQGAGADASGKDASGGQRERTDQASRQGDGGDAQSAGDLWGQVEPCWRALPQRSTAVVTLEVTLNDKGRLATKPRLVRNSIGQLDEAHLVAEAAALMAIQACLPSKARALPGMIKSYRLTFAPAKTRR